MGGVGWLWRLTTFHELNFKLRLLRRLHLLCATANFVAGKLFRGLFSKKAKVNFGAPTPLRKKKNSIRKCEPVARPLSY